MPHHAAFICNLASALVAFVAAVYWYRSARVRYPGELLGSSLIGGTVFVYTEPLVQAALESGRLNKHAAGWSAGAALLIAASSVIEAFPAP